jgi:hypothetical protein
MFHFIVPENKIMICCFKIRYASKLCFRKSETCFHQMNNTMFYETLKYGLQKACCSCIYILRITEHVLCKISLPSDSSSTFQTKMYDMILHYTIDIQKREDANRCSSYVELVVPNYTFNEFRQHFRLTRAIFETI